MRSILIAAAIFAGTAAAPVTASADAERAQRVTNRLVYILNNPHRFKETCSGDWKEDGDWQACRHRNGSFIYHRRDREVYYSAPDHAVYDFLFFANHGYYPDGPGSFTTRDRYSVLYAERGRDGVTLLKYWYW